MAPNSSNSNQAMKMSSLSQRPLVAETGQMSGSIVDHIFRDALPKFITERRHLVDVIKSVYQWNLTRDSKLVSIWTLDLKNGNGSIYAGPAKSRPDCTLTIDERDSLGMFDGTLEPAKAFMTQKLKISGNLNAAHKFQQFFAEESQNLRQHMTGQSSAPEVCAISPKQEEALLQTIPTDGLKSDVVFNIIKTRMSEEPDLVKAFKFVIQFNITRNGKVVAVWTTDTKTEGGQVYRDNPKVKPDAIVNVDDDNYVQILFGKLNPQRAFMSGKIKVKGNILLLQKLDTFWNQVQGQRNDPELPIVKEIMLKDPLKPGLKSEVIMFDLIQKLVRSPNLLDAGSSVLLKISKDGSTASKWRLSFPAGARIGVLERADNASDQGHCLILTIDDNDFVRLTYNTIKLEDAIASGRVKCSGDQSNATKMAKLFSMPILKAKL